jgi:tRNA (guanine37-N1)-methyltransferase
MNIHVITVLPELLESPFSHSILKRAQQKGLVSVHIHNLRDYSNDKHKSVDDYAFGGGAGMVLMAEPLSTIIENLLSERSYDEIIYTSPDGEHLNQGMANQLSLTNNLIIICGHYKGIDQRIRDKYVTKEISLGDFVLSGGEIAAIAIADALIRLLPGVLGNEESALTDSFQDDLLAPPLYTRPETFNGMRVPDVLLSGDHQKIASWRLEQSLERTKKLRPDLYHNIDPEENP